LFESAVEASQQSWSSYEPFTLLSIYKSFQENFIMAYAPCEYIIQNYRNVTKRDVYPITRKYLEENKVAHAVFYRTDLMHFGNASSIYLFVTYVVVAIFDKFN
jgi:hypothetical protein